MTKRIVFSGILDGSRAMEVANRLRDQGSEDIILDFSELEGFESFGVEVLLRELKEPGRADRRVRCAGIPPCLAEQLQEAGIAMAPAPPHLRWAPWFRRYRDPVNPRVDLASAGGDAKGIGFRGAGKGTIEEGSDADQES